MGVSHLPLHWIWFWQISIDPRAPLLVSLIASEKSGLQLSSSIISIATTNLSYLLLCSFLCRDGHTSSMLAMQNWRLRHPHSHAVDHRSTPAGRHRNRKGSSRHPHCLPSLSFNSFYWNIKLVVLSLYFNDKLLCLLWTVYLLKWY